MMVRRHTARHQEQQRHQERHHREKDAEEHARSRSMNPAVSALWTNRTAIPQRTNSTRNAPSRTTGSILRQGGCAASHCSHAGPRRSPLSMVVGSPGPAGAMAQRGQGVPASTGSPQWARIQQLHPRAGRGRVLGRDRRRPRVSASGSADAAPWSGSGARLPGSGACCSASRILLKPTEPFLPSSISSSAALPMYDRRVSKGSAGSHVSGLELRVGDQALVVHRLQAFQAGNHRVFRRGTAALPPARHGRACSPPPRGGPGSRSPARRARHSSARRCPRLPSPSACQRSRRRRSSRSRGARRGAGTARGGAGPLTSRDLGKPGMAGRPRLGRAQLLQVARLPRARDR